MSETSHDRLIAALGADLQPVRRLAHPALRAFGWLLVVLLLAGGLASIADLAAMRHRLDAAPDMWLAMLGSGLTAVAAAFAVFQLGLPDRRPAWALLPLPPALLWIGASGAGCLRDWLIAGTHDASMRETGDCLAFILGFSLPLSFLLVLMLRRGFTLRPGLTAVVGGLAAAAAAATLLNFFHPYDAAATDLVVHAIAVCLVIAGCRWFGGRALALAAR